MYGATRRTCISQFHTFVSNKTIFWKKCRYQGILLMGHIYLTHYNCRPFQIKSISRFFWWLQFPLFLRHTITRWSQYNAKNDYNSKEERHEEMGLVIFHYADRERKHTVMYANDDDRMRLLFWWISIMY